MAHVESLFRQGSAAARDASPSVWAARLAPLGFIARGVVFGLMGAFLIQAAAEADPNQVRGLDGALLELARADASPVLLGLVAAGLVAFGAFCLIMARYRVLSRG
jgi:hypothetical protein